MKKIFKLIEEIGNYYRDYDLHVTKNIIEVKFSPKNTRVEVKLKDKETVFVVNLNAIGSKADILGGFTFSLTEHLGRLKSE